jgi:hypothetical protein
MCQFLVSHISIAATASTGLKLFLFGWQHIYDFMLVQLTGKFKYDSSKVKINEILTKS